MILALGVAAFVMLFVILPVGLSRGWWDAAGDNDWLDFVGR